MKRTTKGRAYVSENWEMLLLLDADDDLENVEHIRQTLVAEHGLVVAVFDVEMEDEDWLKANEMAMSGDKEEAYTILQERGRMS